jgi:uncharacterized membrane protein (DUF106 family)
MRYISTKQFLTFCILDLNTNFVKKGIVKKMAKSTRKKAKRAKSSKKTKKMEKSTTKEQSKAAEYVGHLLELHKLQGVLLAKLYKEV